MKNYINKILALALFFLLHVNAFAENIENGICVSYKVVQAREIETTFFKDSSNAKPMPNDLYVIGYIRQNIPVKYDVSCTLYFYNPGQRGLKRIAKIGWIGTGKFFLLQLGSKDIYSKDLQYEIKIDMRK